MSTSIWKHHLHVAPAWCQRPPSWCFAAQRADLRTLSVVNSPKISRGPSCDQVMEINFHLLIFFPTPKAGSVGQIRFSDLLFSQGDRVTFSWHHPAAAQKDLKQIWMLISGWNGKQMLLSEKYPLAKVLSKLFFFFLFFVLELTEQHWHHKKNRHCWKPVENIWLSSKVTETKVVRTHWLVGDVFPAWTEAGGHLLRSDGIICLPYSFSVCSITSSLIITLKGLYFP